MKFLYDQKWKKGGVSAIIMGDKFFAKNFFFWTLTLAILQVNPKAKLRGLRKTRYAQINLQSSQGDIEHALRLQLSKDSEVWEVTKKFLVAHFEVPIWVSKLVKIFLIWVHCVGVAPV